MKLSLGILAHNEADQIGETIASLLRQTLYSGEAGSLGITEIQTVCIPNGCSDGTAGLARAAFDRHDAASQPGVGHRFEIHEVARGDKCNAWNAFVHERADADADLIALMDADIRFRSPGTLAAMVRLLRERPDVRVATDRPVKVLPEALEGHWFGRLSMAGSGLADPGSGGICGQLYVARADALRAIWLPPGLPVEDGFVRACIVTDGFRSPDNPQLVGRAEGASHTYEGCPTLRQLIHHQKRLVIGSYINSILIDSLWSRMSGPVPPLQSLRDELEANPHWVREQLEARLRREGGRLPPGFAHGRWSRLKGRSTRAQLSSFPIALVGWLFDVYVARLAEASLRRGEGVGFW